MESTWKFCFVKKCSGTKQKTVGQITIMDVFNYLLHKSQFILITWLLLSFGTPLKTSNEIHVSFWYLKYIWLISYWKLRDFGMNSRVPWCVLWYYDINLLVLLLNNIHFTVELIQQLDLFCDKIPLLMRCLFLQTIVFSVIEVYRMRFFLKLLYFIDYNHAILKRNGIILWSDKTMAPCVLLIQSRGCEYLGINPIALSVR